MIPAHVFAKCMKEQHAAMLERRPPNHVLVTKNEFEKIDFELGVLAKPIWRVFPTLCGVSLRVID